MQLIYFRLSCFNSVQCLEEYGWLHSPPFPHTLLGTAIFIHLILQIHLSLHIPSQMHCTKLGVIRPPTRKLAISEVLACQVIAIIAMSNIFLPFLRFPDRYDWQEEYGYFHCSWHVCTHIYQIWDLGITTTLGPQDTCLTEIYWNLCED